MDITKNEAAETPCLKSLVRQLEANHIRAEGIIASRERQIKHLQQRLIDDPIELRQKIANAYHRHKGTNCGCEVTREGKCTQCHFYQGGIHALSELMGQTGIISVPQTNTEVRDG